MGGRKKLEADKKIRVSFGLSGWVAAKLDDLYQSGEVDNKSQLVEELLVEYFKKMSKKH